MRRGFHRRIFWVRLGRTRHNHETSGVRLTLMIVILTLIAAVIAFEIRMKPLLCAYAESQVHNLVILTINRIVEEEIGCGNISYHDLVTLQKDSDDRIMAITTNIPKMNQMKARIANRITEQMMKQKEPIIRIPLGNIIGPELLSGVGPRIPIRIVPLTNVYADFLNSFISAGINQTRHQIMMTFTVKVGILMPGHTYSSEVHSEVCVAETVIVGATPQFFAGSQK